MAEKVQCVMCRGLISVRGGDLARFNSHLANDHEVHFLVISQTLFIIVLLFIISIILRYTLTWRCCLRCPR